MVLRKRSPQNILPTKFVIYRIIKLLIISNLTSSHGIQVVIHPRGPRGS